MMVTNTTAAASRFPLLHSSQGFPSYRTLTAPFHLSWQLPTVKAVHTVQRTEQLIVSLPRVPLPIIDLPDLPK